MEATTKKPRRRKLISVEAYTTGSGDSQTFGCKWSLPMSSATADESVQAAARIMNAVNGQLDFAGSNYRLVMYDVKMKEYVKVTFSEEKKGNDLLDSPRRSQ